MKFMYLLTILVMALSINSTANAEPKRGGGFADDRSQELLLKAKTELLSELDKVNGKTFEANPSLREIVREAITNLSELPKVNRSRNGKTLMFDYNIDSRPYRIEVLEAYYQAYAGTAPERYATEVREVKRRLLHETSHIWGLDDFQARSFSLEVYPITALPPQGEETVVAPTGNICEKTWNAKKVKFKDLNCDGHRFGAFTGSEQLASQMVDLDLSVRVKERADWICKRNGFTKSDSYFTVSGNLGFKFNPDYPRALYHDNHGSWELVWNFERTPRGIEPGTAAHIPQRDYEGKLFDQITCITQ